ncbi:DNA polymerase III subunit alpha [Azospirillaceae bacterium]
MARAVGNIVPGLILFFMQIQALRRKNASPMPYADFVHLRVHSAYSLSEGAIRIKELVKLCQKHGMPAVAVTDSENLFGALEFALAATDAGVQPIIGCLLKISRPSDVRMVAATGKVAKSGSKNASKANQNATPVATPDSLVLLAQNDAGYRNLLKLISISYLGEAGNIEPQIPLSEMEGLTNGLIALTGGPKGTVGRLLAEGQSPAAEQCLFTLMNLFPDRLYIELMRHQTGVVGTLEEQIEPGLLALADKHNLPLVATNDCHFADAEQYPAHDALLCVAGGTYISEEERHRLTPEHRFKSAAEMRTLFADIPEAVDNTLVVARRCSFLLRPIKPILPAFPTIAGRSEAEELRSQAFAGLDERLIKHVYRPDMDEETRKHEERRYQERLDFELRVIEKMKFPGYFLIVSDFIKWAKQHEIPVGPGRGSGAGSLVAWSLLITDLDPIRFGLLFERFLNPERVSMPDFDIDFCQDRRDEVIRYVQKRYGRDRVAQIITFGKLQARAVLRDVGRVLQMPHGQVDKICKLVPNNPANPVTLSDAIAGEPVLQQMRDSDETVARLISIALKLEGLYRHASTHAAGVVIGDRPLDVLIPLYRDPRSDMPVTQFNMKYVEQAGLVKFDFLGLKTLTVLQQAVQLTGQELDLANLPLDDEKTFALLSRAEATGVFQLESTGMRDVLRRLKPNRFEDIIALVALYRPGPMDNIPKYIKVKNGEEPADYLHPSLEPILKETFGIMIYQEQVMQIAQVLSGYTLGGADLLRRAMGKKIQSEMDAQRQIFVDGAKARGVDAAQAGMIFDQVNKFAGYGFNKSHAAAYALVAYQTAWMKANYTVEFLAASMTLDLGNTDKLNVFRQELIRLGVRLLPPDINRSTERFLVERLPEGDKAIRYALAAIKGVGPGAIQSIVKERDSRGPFRDLFDFARRVDPKAVNKRLMENLACAGAFDGMEPNRARAHAAVETLIRYAHAAATERDSGQVSLFGHSADTQLKEPELPSGLRWDALETLQHEFEAIGFYLSAHPLDAYAAPLRRLKVVRSADITRIARTGSGRPIMAGIVVACRERTARSGNRFAFVTLSDAFGVYEVTLFSEVLATCRSFLEAGRMILLKVDTQIQEEGVRLTAQEVRVLEDAVAEVTEGLRVMIRDSTPLPQIKAILDRLQRGKGRVSLVVEDQEAREIEIELPGLFTLTPRLRPTLKAISGVTEIQDI